MTHATYGPISETPLAQFDPNTHCWKMYGVISLWEEQPSLETLPKSGMTVNGKLYPLPALAPPTAETESLLWPTPTTQEIEHPQAELTPTGRRLSKDGKTSHSLNLADSVKMWPTPTARDGKGASGHKKESRRLADLTYRARIVDGVTIGSLNPTWVEWLMGFPEGWTDLEA